MESLYRRANGWMREWGRRLWPDFDERLAAIEATEVVNELGTGPEGFDPLVVGDLIAGGIWMYRDYFRVKVKGVENIPKGAALLICNHSGQLPIDGVMVGIAAFLEGDPPRYVRSMIEKWIPTLPFVSIFFSRLGQLVGTPENCLRLLERGEAVLVFPEGARGINKPFSKRYQLERFGLGFMRLALEAGVPIVPVAVVGAEEQYINVMNLDTVAKALGMPTMPVIPQAFIPILGWIPLPTRYYIEFGAPLSFEGDPDEEDEAVERKVASVKSEIQRMVDEGLERRGDAIFR